MKLEIDNKPTLFQDDNKMTTDDPGPIEDRQSDSLTKEERWNVIFLILAFSCVVANLTLIVGTGAVVILSVGGTTSLAPFALAVVFFGMATVSATLTHWIFAKWGRAIGFWVGCAIGMMGSAIACVGLVQSSPAIVLVAQAFLGGGVGIGMYLRYSAIEVVPAEFSATAITWVLAGGCLAAFIGPEASQATKGVFGDRNWTYLGTFVVAGCFFVLEAIFIALVGFPSTNKRPTMLSCEQAGLPASEQDSRGEAEIYPKEEPPHRFWLILRRRSFLLPLGAAILSWAIMAMPMSIFRITMGELGFTERQSLTVIEFHFFSMYAPGFWSGVFIKKYGTIRACQVAVACFLIAISINLSIQDNANTTAAWYLGFVFLGIGWNFGFSSATVWSMQAYTDAIHLKSELQAANECGMFLISGSSIFCTGYLYEDAGGGGISGWRLLSYTLFSFVALFAVLLAVASASRHHSQQDVVIPQDAWAEEESVQEPKRQLPETSL